MCLNTKDLELLFCLPFRPFFLPTFALLTDFPSMREWGGGGTTTRFVGICVARVKSLPQQPVLALET